MGTPSRGGRMELEAFDSAPRTAVDCLGQLWGLRPFGSALVFPGGAVARCAQHRTVLDQPRAGNLGTAASVSLCHRRFGVAALQDRDAFGGAGQVEDAADLAAGVEEDEDGVAAAGLEGCFEDDREGGAVDQG